MKALAVDYKLNKYTSNLRHANLWCILLLHLKKNVVKNKQKTKEITKYSSTKNITRITFFIFNISCNCMLKSFRLKKKKKKMQTHTKN